MKATLLVSFLTVITILSISFQGCELIGSDDDFVYKLAIPDEYNKVGKLHNEGLDYVFMAIRKVHLENMKNAGSNIKTAQIADYKSIITDATLQFCKEHKSLKDNFAVCQAAVIKSRSNLKSAKIGMDLIDGFNPVQKELVNEIFNGMKARFSKENLQNLKADLDNINGKALRNLSETEAVPIYCATSTAYATYQYWHKNYKKWYFALHYPEILTKYNDAQLNNLSVNNGTLKLKSTTEDGWWTTTWTSVENWWEDGWNDEEETEWFWDALEEMGEADVYGAIGGGSVLSVPGAIAGGCLTSAIEGANQLADKND